MEYRYIGDKEGVRVQVKQFGFWWKTIARYMDVIEAQTLIKNCKITQISKFKFMPDKH